MTTRVKGVNKRTNQVIYENRLKRIEMMILRGVTNTNEISSAFGIGRTETERLIKVILERWKSEDRSDLNEKRIQRTKQLELILNKAIISFEKSQQDEQEISKEIKTCGDCSDGIRRKKDGEEEQCKTCKGVGKIVVERIKIKGQSGDPAFLNIAKEVVKELAKMEGLVQPDPKISSSLLIQSRTIGGEVEQEVRQLYIEAPAETLLRAKLLLEEIDLQNEKKAKEMNPEASVTVVDPNSRR